MSKRSRSPSPKRARIEGNQALDIRVVNELAVKLQAQLEDKKWEQDIITSISLLEVEPEYEPFSFSQNLPFAFSFGPPSDGQQFKSVEASVTKAFKLFVMVEKASVDKPDLLALCQGKSFWLPAIAMPIHGLRRRGTDLGTSRKSA